MEKYIILEKAVGETPLSCAEAFRATRPDLYGIPLSYAGRLDPMASGKLIILIGQECKQQKTYHDFDKEYEFSVLFGIGSDTNDVLGRLEVDDGQVIIAAELLNQITQSMIGEFSAPYPIFSAKTVKGKPLHTWTLEGRLDEIEIPIRTSNIFKLELTALNVLPRSELVASALVKIATIPTVTDERKALGQDFRRVDVRKDWQDILNRQELPNSYQVADFICQASSGTYMRTLAEYIAKQVGTKGLAWAIHRTKIGHYHRVTSELREILD